MGVIRFLADPQILRDCPHPYPAARAVPDWLKQMPMSLAGDESKATVKRCAPFLEAMTAGYIIPLAEECQISRDAAGRFNVRAKTPMIAAHPMEQYAAAPFSKLPVIKFLNPWIVQTQPGYSTLFVSPFNRSEMPFSPLTGIVETDTWYARIHFPSLCMVPPGGSVTLPQGTPIIQAIPFRRETWSTDVGEVEADRVAQTEAEVAANAHAYKDAYWLKHEYT